MPALNDRVTIQARALDANGDPLGPWRAGDGHAAKVRALRGGEPVLQDRLRGVQPYEIRVRSSRRTLQITAAHRAVWKGQVLNIRTVTPSDDGRYLLILADDDGSDA